MCNDLMEFLPGTVFETDKSGIITHMSRTGLEWAGLTEKDIAGGINFLDLVAPKDRERAGEHFGKTLSGERNDGAGYEMIGKDGRPGPALLFCQPFLQNGIIAGIRGLAVSLDGVEGLRETLLHPSETAGKDTAFRCAVEASIPGGIAAIDMEGRQTYCNPSFCSMVGWREEELVGSMPPFPYWPPEYSDLIDKACKETLAGNAPGNGFDLFFMNREGKRFPVRVIISPLIDGKRQIGWIANIIDITECKRTEEALRESEKTLRTLLNVTDSPLFLMDTSGKVLAANAGLVKALGRVGIDFAGMDVHDFLPRGLAEARRKRLLDAICLQKPIRFEDEYKGIYYDHQVAPVVDDQGRVTKVAILSVDITERKHMEEALRKSEERYRLLSENAADVIWQLDADFRFTYISPADERLRGFKQEEVLGKFLWDFLTPEDREKVRQANKSRMDDERRGIATDAVRVELRQMCKDGSLVWTEVNSKPFRDNIGRIVGYHGVVRDISERKKADAALRASEEKYRKLMETARDAIFVADPETGIILDANKQAVSLIGIPVDEIIGMHQTELHPPEEIRRSSEAFIENVKDPEKLLTGLKVRHRDGRDIPVDISSSVVEIGGRKVIQGVFHDITDRLRAEEALRESERKYRLLAEKSLQGISIIGAQPYRFIYVNPMMCEIFGYASHEFLSLQTEEIMRLVHPEDREMVRSRAIQRLSGEKVVPRYEFRITRKNGETRWVEILASKTDYEGEDAILAAVLDITSRKEAEEQLARKRKMEAMGTLAAGIAHDFNNILNAIAVNLEIARREAAYSPSLRQSLATIKDCEKRAAALVDEILIFSGKRFEKKSLFELEPLIAEVLQIESYSGMPENVLINNTINCDGSSLVMGNKMQLQRVLINIIDNAVKALGKNGGTITIGLSAEDHLEGLATFDTSLPPGPYYRLSISDTGCGIDPLTTARLFEPFFTTRHENGGSGLGLAIVHGIVRGHDGGLLVESHPGAGTVFYVFLPAVAPSVTAIREMATPALSPVEGKAAGVGISHSASLPGEGICVMLVDDEPLNVTNWKIALEMEGFTVQGFLSGAEALAAFERQPQSFSIVISDLRMPGMSGTDLIKSLRLIRPDIPILLSTGWIDEETTEHLLSSGVSRILSKPHDLETVLEAILQFTAT